MDEHTQMQQDACTVDTVEQSASAPVPETAVALASAPAASEAPAEAAPEAAAEAAPASAAEPARLVVFDFDGTCISGNSPVQLYKYLVRHKMLRTRYVIRIFLWGAAYLFHFPQDEAGVRGLVFSAFEGWPTDKVDQFIRNFYDEEIEPLYRAPADDKMREHMAAGDTVVVISATFEQIIKRAMETHAFKHQVSVRMKVDENGCYTREVDGIPIEGEEKVRRVERFGDEMFGPGNWVLAVAYGDHYSDIPLLESAQTAFAVTPGPALKREAKKRGWGIL